ncbi:hypothetical protein GCM10009641_02840 [Mycobacterium cookii]|uniref:Uncharacterized protein n=1 Tax=Mycobacterium cookii TaxID=1775 RepID=A0A7I7L2Q6_9MYCO|nr:hypothetical protein MCOO_46850 [Mycobacterium cookii]
MRGVAFIRERTHKDGTPYFLVTYRVGGRGSRSNPLLSCLFHVLGYTSDCQREKGRWPFEAVARLVKGHPSTP